LFATAQLGKAWVYVNCKMVALINHQHCDCEQLVAVKAQPGGEQNAEHLLAMLQLKEKLNEPIVATETLNFVYCGIAATEYPKHSHAGILAGYLSTCFQPPCCGGACIA
jgi:hypothetical protein